MLKSVSEVFRISEMAKSPIRAGNRSNPLSRAWRPNVNLGNASIGAEPTKASAIPIRPLANPLESELPDKLAIIVRENMAMANNSNGPNFKATYLFDTITNVSRML